ncbi:FolC bifunctional protein [Desulfonema ishimotonii]|uniref:Dihydrofolate synthase/folylpolyglutamate synthase n=1 Tax=Desulfonema ishimotonii TaxID=45657 RepID=A0A401FQN4_9BACT|nr:folylpolyglutamate synthase/dihydrofolate synthase family protein [Desulfonema ishimotonii]GBC59287.1 FolC bifunctional protein [Desulfonema ishimotonii]
MNQEKEYRQCLETMYGFRRFGIKLGLDTIRRILSGLGNPQDRFKTIHIAGTNGKGSVASSLSAILHEAGYRVGLYTSPHLLHFNERICVDNQPISDAAVVRAFSAVRETPKGEREPTFFEFATAMAMYEFARQKTDWAVVETGMGGRLDATNVLKPEISVITNVSVEHSEYLGDTLEQITGEKGGIIKPGIPVVTGVRQESAFEVLQKIAGEKSAPLYRFGKDFRTTGTPDQTFTYTGIRNTWPDMRTRLAGSHQIDNAALTLAACEIITENGANIPEEAIRRGLHENCWPGRLEVVSESPYLILDGAHNLAAAENLAKFLKETFDPEKITLVLGILDDKPYAEMLRFLLPVCRNAILTQPKIHRALPVDTLRATAGEIRSELTSVPDVARAVAYAMENAAPDDVICVAGSLYVVGEAKEFLETLGFPSFRKTLQGDCPPDVCHRG